MTTPSKYADARSATHRLIRRLEHGLETRDPYAVRAVATLRRATGRDPEECPEALGIICDVVDADHQGDGWVSDTERATFVAVTLWALHSQSTSQSMYLSSSKDNHAPTIGQAVRLLAYQDGSPLSDHPLSRRWQYLIAADTTSLFAARARSVISQLRRAGIGFDYADLAGALVHWDTYPEHRRKAILRWSRDIRKPKNTDNDTSSNTK